MSVKIKLGHRRPARPAAPCKPTTGCTCVIHHAITPEAIDAVLDEIILALINGETHRIGHLEMRLKTEHCPARNGGAQ